MRIGSAECSHGNALRRNTFLWTSEAYWQSRSNGLGKSLGSLRRKWHGRSGVSHPTLNRLESASQNVTLRTLAQLCQALRCEPGDLFWPGQVRLQLPARVHRQRR